MSNAWVCKFDGTIQCEESEAITLEVMKEELAAIIGSDNILGMEKRSEFMVQLCGMPTGVTNAYEITSEGWQLLNRGIVGPQGFSLCTAPDQNSKGENLARVIGAFTSSNPTTVRELIGHSLRVYRTGDALTQDWRPERVNIETNELGKIEEIWFG